MLCEKSEFISMLSQVGTKTFVPIGTGKAPGPSPCADGGRSEQRGGRERQRGCGEKSEGWRSPALLDADTVGALAVHSNFSVGLLDRFQFTGSSKVMPARTVHPGVPVSFWKS